MEAISDMLSILSHLRDGKELRNISTNQYFKIQQEGTHMPEKLFVEYFSLFTQKCQKFLET
jgi:hypothetical protein